MKTDSCPILRVGDIRDKLLEWFPNEITISCPSKHHNNTQYILPVGISLTSDIIDAALHGGSIAKTTLIRSAANHINEDMQKHKERKKWPPTPQDILQDGNSFNVLLFNLIAWSIDPSAPISKTGLVNLPSKNKAFEVTHLCKIVESLLAHGQPSYNQVLLALFLHRKSGARDILDIIQKYGYCLSYKETTFIEDMWAEWDRRQNDQMPENISKNVTTTLVADNIDWKINILVARKHTTQI